MLSGSENADSSPHSQIKEKVLVLGVFCIKAAKEGDHGSRVLLKDIDYVPETRQLTREPKGPGWVGSRSTHGREPEKSQICENNLFSAKAKGATGNLPGQRQKLTEGSTERAISDQ